MQQTRRMRERPSAMQWVSTTSRSCAARAAEMQTVMRPSRHASSRQNASSRETDRQRERGRGEWTPCRRVCARARVRGSESDGGARVTPMQMMMPMPLLRARRTPRKRKRTTRTRTTLMAAATTTMATMRRHRLNQLNRHRWRRRVAVPAASNRRPTCAATATRAQSARRPRATAARAPA
jgi:hypothetical protein